MTNYSDDDDLGPEDTGDDDYDPIRDYAPPGFELVGLEGENTEPGDLEGEQLSLGDDAVGRDPIPPEEVTRRGLIFWTSGALVLLLMLQMGLALLLSAEKYQVVGGPLATASAFAAAALGVAFAYYFTHPRK